MKNSSFFFGAWREDKCAELWVLLQENKSDVDRIM